MKRVLVLLVVAVVVLVTPPALAQSATTGQIEGRVTDEQGGPLPGVTVTASSPALQGSRVVTTDQNGRFNLAVLPIGSYRIKFSLPGHQALELTDLAVQLGRATPVAMTLQKGEMVEAVTVTAEYPLIQTKTADNSYNMNRETLDTIPTAARSFRDLTKYVPSITSVELNTTDASTTGFPSIRGEGQYGDNYMVDGLTVRDPSVFTTGTALNFDAMEEVQIVVDGFSPEYGQALGGSVNVVTRSGSNTFGGEVAYIYTSDSLSAGYEPTVISTQSEFHDKTPYINVGGPILKDKLWYFASYNRTDASDTFPAVDKPGFGLLAEGVTETTDDLYFGKLTWALSANHNVSGNYTYSTPQTDGLDASTATPEARRTRERTDKRLRLNYQGILGPNSVLDVKYGNVTHDSDAVPLSFGPANYELVSLQVDTNNAWRQQIDHRRRNDYAGTFTQFWNPGGWAGSHEFKVGYEVHEPEQNSGDNFTGLDEDVFADTFSNGVKFTLVNAQTSTSGAEALIPSVLNEYRSSGILKNRNEEQGYFVQDRWEKGKWNFLLGFRADKEKAFNDADEVFARFDFDRSFSPRLSVTWDATGDGKNVFKTGWGRFYDVSSVRFGEFANTRESFSFRDYEWDGAPVDPDGDPDTNDSPWDGVDFRDHIDAGDEFDIHNPANWLFLHEQSNESNPLDYGGVKSPPHQDRFLVEYDRQILNDYAFKVRFVDQEARGLIDDIHYFYNDFRVENTNLKRRDYQSFEVEFNGNPRPNLSFNTSWVHSSSKGTSPGQFESSGFLGNTGSGNDIGVFLDRPPSNPQGWCDLYGPTCIPPSWNPASPRRDYNNDEVVDQFDRDLFIQTVFAGLGGLDGDDNWYGYLPYSIDDQVKMYGRVTIPQWANTYVTAFLQWASGYHTQRRGFQGAYGDYLTFSQVPGSFDFVGSCDPGEFATCEAVLVTTNVPGQDFNGESGLLRGSLENSSFWSLDMSIGKSWALQKRFAVEVRAELFNVLNNQIPVAIQDRAVDNFGEPLTRIQPRSARMFTRLSF